MKVYAGNVEALAQRKESENCTLRQYLKWQDRLSEEELDQLVFDVADRVGARFDCATCANCCKELQPGVTDTEVLRLADRFGISEKEFHERYLMPAEDPEDEPDGARRQIRGKPCPFLADNRCIVYEDRPRNCRKYPYLHEPEFSYRTLGMIERTYACPIVYQVFEELKAELPYDQMEFEQW